VREQRKEQVIVGYSWAASSGERPLSQVNNFICYPSGNQVFAEGCMQKFVSSVRLPLVTIPAWSINLEYIRIHQDSSFRSVDEEELPDNSLPGLYWSGAGHEPWIQHGKVVSQAFFIDVLPPAIEHS
jgi:hypothetical protein